MSDAKDPAGVELVYSKDVIAREVMAMGARIDADYAGLVSRRERLLVLGVLNGAFVFMADLIRQITLPLEVDFIRLSSYEDRSDSAHEVVLIKAPERPIEGKHVLVVEDIADCGLTLRWLLGYLNAKGPASLKTAVCVDKRERRETPVKLDYTCFAAEGGFLVGYGLDYGKSYRELDGIYRLVFDPGPTGGGPGPGPLPAGRGRAPGARGPCPMPSPGAGGIRGETRRPSPHVPDGRPGGNPAPRPLTWSGFPPGSRGPAPAAPDPGQGRPPRPAYGL
jgi:hypoxanthine phosphoribosyltransferase